MSSEGSVSVKRRKLNQEHGAQSLWLVRLPTEIADLWSGASNDEIIGQASIKLLPSTNNSAAIPTRQLEVTLPDSRVFVVEDQHPPLSQGSMGSAKIDTTSFFAFSEHETRRDTTFSLQGKVTKRCVLRAKNPDSRRKSQQNAVPGILGQNRLLSAQEIRERQSQQLQQQQSVQMEGVSSSLLPAALQTNALTVLSDNEISLVENEMLAAFQTSSAISIAELLVRAKRKVPGVTDALLRPLVKRFADYRQSGAKRGLWELKPEFRSLSTGNPITNLS